MNAAVTAALVAAQHSQPDPVTRLTKAGAIRREDAIAIDPASPTEAKQIDQAIAQGVIQRRGDGRLFVNPRAVEERNARMGYQLLIATLILLSILASSVALLKFATG